MAIYYVDDTATGLNNGTSKTDAWVAIASSVGVAAGSFIWVADTHNELPAPAANLDWANGTNASPVRIISVDFGTDAYSAGALFGSSGGNVVIAGCVEIFGISLQANNDMLLFNNPNENQKYFECTFSPGTGAGNDLFLAGDTLTGRFENCTMNLYDQWLSVGGDYSLIQLFNCTINRLGGDVPLLAGIELNSHWQFYGCDLSSWTNLLDASLEAFGSLDVIDCLVSSGTASLATGSQTGVHVLIERSHSDTNLTAPKLGLQYYLNTYGNIQSTLSVYRTVGADDGEQANAHSWAMTSKSNALEFYLPFESPWGTRWIDGGSSVTLTFYVASGATLNDDDFWVELLTPDESASSTTQADFRTSRMANPLATPAALTTDSGSTWNGSGVTVKQKISFTFTPDIAGPVKFRFCLAKPSTTVYVDPLCEVS